MSSLALSFHDVNFNPVVQEDNQIWLTSRELGQALGYAREDSVIDILLALSKNKKGHAFNVTFFKQ